MTVNLTTLSDFAAAVDPRLYYDGTGPVGGVIADANGNLFGTTVFGGAYDMGMVFEIAKTATGYASAPTILVSFNGTDGAGPSAGVIFDANGDLLGTTGIGGTTNNGTVFEIARTATGYASTPTTLVDFNLADGRGPQASLIADSNGNLFGTTGGGGTLDLGTIFEVPKTATGYATTPITLASLDGSAGIYTQSALFADAYGNLLGTTPAINGLGTVFEVAKTATGYASNATPVVTFNGADGSNLWGSLIADANGNLFGTTSQGGLGGVGTVFEIVRTASGYASTPITLVDFNGTDGARPLGNLIIDANGNLFGTTLRGGAYGGANWDGTTGDGTVFEIAKTASGYASTPITLFNFNGTDGAFPRSGLIADPNGDLFGTTVAGGTDNGGTVFEFTGSGFVPAPPTIINGPRGGHATIQGTTGPDIITAFGTFNTIFANGGNDVIDAGRGHARVYVNTGNVSVTLRGAENTVQGFPGRGAAATAGADGNVSVTGSANKSTVLLGNGQNTIDLSGKNNKVVAGNGDNVVSLTGGGAEVALGEGTNDITLTGHNNCVRLGAGSDSVNGGSGDRITLNGTNLLLNGGKNAMVFIANGPSNIDDRSLGMTAYVGRASGDLTISDIANDTRAVIDLTGGVGGYHCVSQVLAALTPDGSGGTMLALGNAGSIDFMNTSQSDLTAANFRISHFGWH